MGALESGESEELNALVDMAALVAGAPIALITLVDDDEQVFKATYGLDAPGTPRDISFCGHALAEGHEAMVITDSRLDPRFADNPLVTGEPHVIFYAGIPLVTGAGHAIGTLCVVDATPRELDARQMDALHRLAGQAVGLLELARREKPLGAQADPHTGLPMREAMIREVTSRGDLSAPGSAIAVRVEEIDSGGPRGGLLAEGALRAVARAMGDCLPGTARIARAFGSFLIVLPGVEGTRARSIVAAMRDRLRGAVVVEPDLSVHVGLAAGVASIAPGSKVDAEDLLAAAEDVLATAESFGNGYAVVDGDDLHAPRQRAQRIRADLGAAVTEGQLVVHYQPVVRIRTAEWIGAEALIRWRHPEIGLIMPDEFIPFAEDMDIVREIDRYVLRRALHDLAAGFIPGHEVSVNMSPTGLLPGLPDAVASDLRDAGVPAGALVIEITERLRVDREPQSIRVLEEIAEMGVRIAVDDFGAGTTSIAQLRQMPVARLKLDRSLVNDLDGPDARRAALVVRALSGLAHDLGVEVLAEGIEEPSQANALIREGVELGQGYLFGRPGPLREA